MLKFYQSHKSEKNRKSQNQLQIAPNAQKWPTNMLWWYIVVFPSDLERFGTILGWFWDFQFFSDLGRWQNLRMWGPQSSGFQVQRPFSHQKNSISTNFDPIWEKFSLNPCSFTPIGYLNHFWSETDAQKKIMLNKKKILCGRYFRDLRFYIEILSKMRFRDFWVSTSRISKKKNPIGKFKIFLFS